MTPERYLRTYDDLNCYIIEADAEIRKLEEKRAKLYVENTTRLDGMPRPPGPGNPVAKLAEKIGAVDAQIKRLQVAIEVYMQRMQAIEDTVQELDLDERNVARLRYMRPRPMRWDEIAAALNYSERQCRRINKTLLKKISQKMSVTGHKLML